jgi:hypothetical protein
MKTLLAVLALSAALTGSALASTTAPIVIADGAGGCSGCVVDQPSDAIQSEPQDGGNQGAKVCKEAKADVIN